MDIASTTSPSVAFQNQQQVEPPVIQSRQAPAVQASTPKTQPLREQAQPSKESADKAVQQVNNAFLEKQKNLFAAIERDKLTGISVFKIMDKSTNEVVRQLPSKEVVSFAQALEVPQGWRGQLILDKI